MLSGRDSPSTLASEKELEHQDAELAGVAEQSPGEAECLLVSGDGLSAHPGLCWKRRKGNAGQVCRPLAKGCGGRSGREGKQQGARHPDVQPVSSVEGLHLLVCPFVTAPPEAGTGRHRTGARICVG